MNTVSHLKLVQFIESAIKESEPDVIITHHPADTNNDHLRVEYYDELERTCTESFIIEPNGTNVAVSIPIGVWHTVHALESGTCILEMKNGAYEPLSEADVLG